MTEKHRGTARPPADIEDKLIQFALQGKVALDINVSAGIFDGCELRRLVVLAVADGPAIYDLAKRIQRYAMSHSDAEIIEHQGNLLKLGHMGPARASVARSNERDSILTCSACSLSFGLANSNLNSVTNCPFCGVLLQVTP